MKLSRLKKLIPELFLLFVICYLLLLIKPALLGELTGTFKPSSVPSDYVKLEEFLVNQKQFSRTFWVPTTQRFGFASNAHPEISGEDFYSVASVSGVLDALNNTTENGKLKTKSSAENLLQEAGVKYVVVPYDSEGEIFLTDRKYDEKLYQATVASVSAIPWLTRVPGFGNIAVFALPNPKDHFYIVPIGELRMTNCELNGRINGLRITDCELNNQIDKLSSQSTTRNTKLGNSSITSIHMINPTKYEVTVKNVQKGDRLVFSEGYDRYWTAALRQAQDENVKHKTENGKGETINSSVYDGRFNSFVLPQSGNYTLSIYYTPQNYVNIGLWISGIMLFAIILYFFLLMIKRLPSLKK